MTKQSDRGDSTPRVSTHPQDGQPGPSADSEGPTTDTRGSLPKSQGKAARDDSAARAEFHPEDAGNAKQTPHTEAVKQPIRQTDQQTGVEDVTVDGEPVTVVAEPGFVDPTELMPHRADTIIKDQLRESGNAELADWPAHQPADDGRQRWHDEPLRVKTERGGTRDYTRPSK